MFLHDCRDHRWEQTHGHPTVRNDTAEKWKCELMDLLSHEIQYIIYQIKAENGQNLIFNSYCDYLVVSIIHPTFAAYSLSGLEAYYHLFGKQETHGGTCQSNLSENR